MKDLKVVSQALVMITLSIVVAVSARGASLPGQEAYIRHNYAKAMKEYMADNSPRAMYMIGYMLGMGRVLPWTIKLQLIGIASLARKALH